MKNFTDKKAALKHLNENPLACVAWGNQCAIYWNGKISIQGINEKKNWN